MSRKFVASLVAFIMIVTCVSILPVYASSEDYRSWSQSDDRWGDMTLGDSPTATVRKYGCTSVAVAKLMRQSGAAGSDFTPATFVERMNAIHGYALMADSQPNGVMYYNKTSQLFEGFTYKGQKSYSNSAVIDAVNAGKYIIVIGKTKSGSEHYCAVDNALTISNGYVTIMNSWTPSSNVNLKTSDVFSSLTGYLLFEYTVPDENVAAFNG